VAISQLQKVDPSAGIADWIRSGERIRSAFGVREQIKGDNRQIESPGQAVKAPNDITSAIIPKKASPSHLEFPDQILGTFLRYQLARPFQRPAFLQSLLRRNRYRKIFFAAQPAVNEPFNGVQVKAIHHRLRFGLILRHDRSDTGRHAKAIADVPMEQFVKESVSEVNEGDGFLLRCRGQVGSHIYQ
jgi:hypothetical protein